MKQTKENLKHFWQGGELTEGILGKDGAVTIKWVRLSLVIVGLHTELILVSRLQPRHLQLGRVSISAATWHPAA